MIAYSMNRGGRRVAQVVTLDSGKCVVAWPTSTIIYDSEEAARAVHIQHMGGRGEPTWLVPEWGSGKSFVRGMECAAMDENESAPYASITDNYRHIVPTAPAWKDLDGPSFIAGYLAQMARQSTSTAALLAEIDAFAVKQQKARQESLST